jgi:hypothetical protein
LKLLGGHLAELYVYAFLFGSVLGNGKHVRANIECMNVGMELADPYRVMPLAATRNQHRFPCDTNDDSTAVGPVVAESHTRWVF